MSVQSEINRIKTNISNAYASLENKGVALPSEHTSDNLASTIDSLDIAKIRYNETTKVLTVVTNSGG
jgi:hypothetical protein